MRLPIALLLVLGLLIGVPSYRKQQSRKAEAARVAAQKDSIRVADSVALAEATREEARQALAQASADRRAAYDSMRREAIAKRHDAAEGKTYTKQRAVMTPGATNANRPPLD